MINYTLPDKLIKYRPEKIVENLTKAKAAVLSLTEIPYQRSWVDKLQVVQLKSEIAGTSKIEGADFTDKELDAAMSETPEQLFTRSQRQANSALKTYKWIQEFPRDKSIDENTIFEIHRLIVTGADDDHCPPGELRKPDINVHFGTPPHRGASGGDECNRAFFELCRSVQEEFRAHDPLIQALALHYHLAAMHPFQDGNGRTARALEALMLQRVGLKDTLFIAMSNYYYEEKANYIKTLAVVRAAQFDLTDFLNFGLKGIEMQCSKLFQEIKRNVSKALYKNVMYDLFGRLRSQRKKVIGDRQIMLLNLFLEAEHFELNALREKTEPTYKSLKNPFSALVRDLSNLISLKALRLEKANKEFHLYLRLEWPTEITETAFFQTTKQMPKAKTLTLIQ
jgi:Fic family protein